MESVGSDSCSSRSWAIVSLPAGIFFELDEGLISRVSTYYNLADWITQVEKG